MKCFKCGKEKNKYICASCTNDKTVESICDDILCNNDLIKNENIKEYVKENNLNYLEKLEIINEIIEDYSGTKKNYYKSWYLLKTKKERSEKFVWNWIKNSDLSVRENQLILNELLGYYSEEGDYINLEKVCDLIYVTKNLYLELYLITVQYYSYVGEYQKAEKLIDKVSKLLNQTNKFLLPSSTKEKCEKKLNDYTRRLNNYKAGKVYWPKTVEKKFLLAKVYDQKGINYDGKKFHTCKKTPENEFEKTFESEDYNIKNYTAFWVNYFTYIKDLKIGYEISAIKVKDNVITETFSSFLNSSDGKKANDKILDMTSLDEKTLKKLNNCETVDNFLRFIGNDTLVSTDALGNQQSVLVRVLRYSSIKKLDNPFLDLLDYADNFYDTFKFDSNRETLLKYFNLNDTEDAKGKAENNIHIFNNLKGLEDATNKKTN